MSEHAPVQTVQAPAPQAPPANTFHLQRKCACGSYAGGGECDKCRHDGKKRLQRVAVNNTTADGIPSIVTDVLGSSGQPLDAATRAWMEPRFRHDFSNVRVHTDTRAAQSAQAVNALAYTVGRDVVFSAGQYEPATARGSRLLAHELTHVVQQDMAGSSTSQFSRAISHPSDGSETEADAISDRVLAGESVNVRQPPTAVLHGQLNAGEIAGITVGAAVGGALLGLGIYGLYSLLTGLSPEQKRQLIASAKGTAQTWIGTALPKLNAFIAGPSLHTTDIDAARQALHDHFDATDAATATTVRDRLTSIQTILTNWARMSLVIHDDSDLLCRDSAAYVDPSNANQIVFCPSFFEASDVFRATSLIHEVAHTLTGGPNITDRGYQPDRVYPVLNTAEALTNAESFALLVQDLGGPSRAPLGGPTDVGQDCPADWRGLLDIAIARGQRWNRNAQVALADRNPAWLTPLLNTHLGGATPALMDAALAVYTQAADALSSSVQFECETEGGGRCDSSETYWYAIWSDFHICPSWKNIGNEDDRIESLLRGFYGYAAGVGDQAGRQNYARLARCLTHTTPDWQTPGAAADPAC